MNRRNALAASALALAFPALLLASDRLPKMSTTPSGLQFADLKLGRGAKAEAGRQVKVLYTGWLFVDGAKGKKFDSATNRRKPFRFALGKREVIAGWDEGVEGMKVGGKRLLIIPSALGYGEKGAGKDIPPGSTLMFEVDLLGVD